MRDETPEVAVGQGVDAIVELLLDNLGVGTVAEGILQHYDQSGVLCARPGGLRHCGVAANRPGSFVPPLKSAEET